MSLGIFNIKTPLGASTIPGTCWDKPGFKACHAKKWEQARTDCTTTGAQDFNGNMGKCIEVMADAYAFNDCVPQLCPESPLVSAPTQVGPIYASGDPCDSKNTIKFVQTVVGTSADGKWGTLSNQAYLAYKAQTGKDWYDIAPGCVGTGPYPRVTSPVVPTPAPTPVPIPEEVPPPAPPPQKVSKATMLASVGVLAALGVGGYYYGTKKGWFA